MFWSSDYIPFVITRHAYHGILLLVERPYRVPVSKWGAVLFVVPPIAGIIFVLLLCSWMTLLFTVFTLVLGIFLGKLHKFAVAHSWFEFVDTRQMSDTNEDAHMQGSLI